jgi:hypothetical protein
VGTANNVSLSHTNPHYTVRCGLAGWRGTLLATPAENTWVDEQFMSNAPKQHCCHLCIVITCLKSHPALPHGGLIWHRQQLNKTATVLFVTDLTSVSLWLLYDVSLWKEQKLFKFKCSINWCIYQSSVQSQMLSLFQYAYWKLVDELFHIYLICNPFPVTRITTTTR